METNLAQRLQKMEGRLATLERQVEIVQRQSEPIAPGSRWTRKMISDAGRAAQALRKTQGGGRPRSDKPRCPCGAMTAKRAATRRHKC